MIKRYLIMISGYTLMALAVYLIGINILLYCEKGSLLFKCARILTLPVFLMIYAYFCHGFFRKVEAQYKNAATAIFAVSLLIISAATVNYINVIYELTKSPAYQTRHSEYSDPIDRPMAIQLVNEFNGYFDYVCGSDMMFSVKHPDNDPDTIWQVDLGDDENLDSARYGIDPEVKAIKWFAFDNKHHEDTRVFVSRQHILSAARKIYADFNLPQPREMDITLDGKYIVTGDMALKETPGRIFMHFNGWGKLIYYENECVQVCPTRINQQELQ